MKSLLVLLIFVITLCIEGSVVIRLSNCEMCNKQNCELIIRSEDSNISNYNEFMTKSILCLCKDSKCGVRCEKKYYTQDEQINCALNPFCTFDPKYWGFRLLLALSLTFLITTLLLSFGLFLNKYFYARKLREREYIKLEEIGELLTSIPLNDDLDTYIYDKIHEGLSNFLRISIGLMIISTIIYLLLYGLRYNIMRTLVSERRKCL